MRHDGALRVTAATTPRVEVLTVAGCHLCADAVSVVSALCESAGVSWVESDLFARPEDEVCRWRDLVPVVLVDGEVVETLRVDERRIRGLLSAPNVTKPSGV